MEFGDDGFQGGRKTRETQRKKSSEQGKNQQQTQPTFGTGTEFNLGRTDWRQVLSTLCHHCYPKTRYQLQSMSFKERRPIVCLKSDNLTTADTRFDTWQHFPHSRIILRVEAWFNNVYVPAQLPQCTVLPYLEGCSCYPAKKQNCTMNILKTSWLPLKAKMLSTIVLVNIITWHICHMQFNP